MTHEAMELLRECQSAVKSLEGYCALAGDIHGTDQVRHLVERISTFLTQCAAPDSGEGTPETTRTFDTQTWAKSFNETLVKLGYQPHDEGWMIGWFANAIMCGYNHALSLREKREGMVEVPIEPTAEMKREGAAFLPITPSGATLTAAERVWSAMLAAAPPAGEVKKKGPSGEMA